MSRPKHPGTPLPASCISRLVENQSRYDADPERYEAEEAGAQQEAEAQAHHEMEMQAQAQEGMEQEESYAAEAEQSSFP